MAEEGKKAGREMQGLVDVGMNNDSSKVHNPNK